LRVRVLRATNLRNADLLSDSDPYVVLHCHSNGGEGSGDEGDGDDDEDDDEHGNGDDSGNGNGNGNGDGSGDSGVGTGKAASPLKPKVSSEAWSLPSSSSSSSSSTVSRKTRVIDNDLNPGEIRLHIIDSHTYTCVHMHTYMLFSHVSSLYSFIPLPSYCKL
jgi:hypothetical protein